MTAGFLENETMMKRTKVEKNRILEKYYVSFKAKRQAALKKVINKELDQIDPEDHCHLLAVVPQSAADYTSLGGGQAGMDLGAGCGRDCSSGCKWYLELAGELGRDWGICANPNSHRVGLLTFEHQGCANFEHMSVIDKKYTRAVEIFGKNEDISTVDLARQLKVPVDRAKKIIRGLKRHLVGFHG